MATPRVTSTRRQPTTGRGRIVRPVNPRISMGTLGLIAQARHAGRPAAAPAAPSAGPAGAAAAGAQYNLNSLPPDASYDAQVASLQRQRDDQFAGLAAGRTQGLLDYGFNEGPAGQIAFDPNNPNSKAALLKKTYDTNRRSTGQSMGAGGQLYNGAFQNAQDLVNRNQATSEDQMQKSLIGFLARNTQQRTQAGTGYETAVGQAYGDRVGRFQNNPLYDPAASPDPAAAPAAAGGVPSAASFGTQAQRYAQARRKNPRGVWGR